jgi:hypothetical protein
MGSGWLGGSSDESQFSPLELAIGDWMQAVDLAMLESAVADWERVQEISSRVAGLRGDAKC